MNKPIEIILHHTASFNGLNADNRYHKSRWPNFISQLGYHLGYHYYISYPNGEITQAREETEEGAHTLGGHNRKSIGIALMGHLDNQKPSQSQLEAIRGLVEAIQQRWNIPDNKIYAHKELWPTVCPGINGFEVVKRLRDTKPALKKLQKQIALLVEAIAKLQLLFNRLFKK